MKIRIVAKQDITNVLDKEGLLALNAYYEEIVECDVYDRISIADKFLNEHPEYENWLINISKVL